MRENYDDDESHFYDRSNPPFFIGDIFFLLILLLPPRHRARDREWRFEGVFCLSLSVSASFFARARSCCVPSWMMASCCSLVVLLLLELNWCLGFFTHTKAL